MGSSHLAIWGAQLKGLVDLELRSVDTLVEVTVVDDQPVLCVSR